MCDAIVGRFRSKCAKCLKNCFKNIYLEKIANNKGRNTYNGKLYKTVILVSKILMFCILDFKDNVLKKIKIPKFWKIKMKYISEPNQR